MSTKTAARPIRRKRPTPGQVLEQAVEIGKVVSALRPFGVKQRMIAQATGAAERSVRNWKRTSVIGPTYEKRLRDLQQIALILEETLVLHGVGQWLNAPNRLLQHRRPIDVLGEGDVERVRKAALAFVEGVYV